MTAKDRLIVALDVDTLETAGRLVEELAPYVGCFKVGLQLLTSCGAPQVVKQIHAAGGEVFFDGKFDDIPNTVAGAARAAAALGVKFFDVHACCGKQAMEAAVAHRGNSQVLAVTVLTSLDDKAAQKIFGNSSQKKVAEFAAEALAAGVDGIVCSPQELSFLATIPALQKLLKVTPGVRPEWASADDQKRTLTPQEAIRAGATQLVIGRPILKPPAAIGTPVAAAKKILEEIEEALK